MNEHSALERRVAALITAYADRAPIDVDPTAIARRIAAGSQSTSPLWSSFVPSRGLAFTLAVLALLGTIAAGALIAGAQPFRRDPVEVLTDRALVEPFIGFPPEGVAPSTPETGQLVLSFNGRVSKLGMEFHRVWVFADGRLIWKRNLEGTGATSGAFGTTKPTTAVIEQHLTPEGVELLRAMAVASGLRDIEAVGTSLRTRHGLGVLWGGLAVRVGGGLVDAGWSDSKLPGLLADPASWMPASAWDDTRVGAYVPSRYAVCMDHVGPARLKSIGPAGVWDLLPEHIRMLIRSRAIEDPIPEWHEIDARCLFEVSTDDARVIAAALDDAGLSDGIPIPDPPGRGEAIVGEGIVQILVVLPNGDVACHCG
jgi:hypothetical protein